MAWDKALPDGDLSIAQGDDDIRTNNNAVESALDLEHDFTTGGTQTGRHHFTVDSSATIDGITPTAAGAIALEDTVRPTAVLKYWDGSAWQYADIGTGDMTRFDENQTFTAAQSSTWVTVTPGGGSIAVDLTASPTKKATITTNITIANPSGAVASACQNFILEITMSGGGHTISWGSAYRSSFGTPPVYDDTASAVNVFHCMVLSSGSVLVSSLADVSPF